jgi:hypothetical protein
MCENCDSSWVKLASGKEMTGEIKNEGNKEKEIP